MSINLFSSSIPLSIPSELSSREPWFSYEVGIVLFTSFLLIAFARLARPTIYASLSLGMIKVGTVRTHILETFPLNKRGSLLLIVNYLLSTGLVVYLCLEDTGVWRMDQLLIATATPFALLMGGLVSMRLTGLITGEYEVLKAPFIMKILGTQSIGLIYFICAMVWVLNPDYKEVLVQVVIWTFVIESILRIIKSILVVYVQGVPLYYIILYFCTLEILPPFVVYYFVMQDFIG
ncbi:MAG: DUF4271 domain-containing protein [Crocinitomicaceae bacterium]|nr:DUF4271 domain-containing protein [Crocinitomicaceae bacterium]